MASNFYYSYSAVPQNYTALPAGTAYVQPAAAAQTAYAAQPTAYVATPSAQTVIQQYDAYGSQNASVQYATSTAAPVAAVQYAAQPAAAVQYAAPLQQTATAVQYASTQPTAVQYATPAAAAAIQYASTQTQYPPGTAFYSAGVTPSGQQILYAVDPAYQQTYQPTQQAVAAQPAPATYDTVTRPTAATYYPSATIYAATAPINQQPTFVAPVSAAPASFYSSSFPPTTTPHQVAQQLPTPAQFQSTLHTQQQQHQQQQQQQQQQVRQQQQQRTVSATRISQSNPSHSTTHRPQRPASTGRLNLPSTPWIPSKDIAAGKVTPSQPSRPRLTSVTGTATFKRSSTSEQFRHRLTATATSSPSFQLHYCHVCKITCSGQKSYLEHLDSVKHRKLEVEGRGASASTAKTPTTPSTQNATPSRLYCEVCRVQCTNADTYAVHVRSSNHQKNLMLTAGKPTLKAMQPNNNNNTPTRPTVTPLSAIKIGIIPAKTGPDVRPLMSKLDMNEAISPNVTAIGLEYVEEFSLGPNRVVTYSCKLCECRFSDTLGKTMHCKGRRHRVQYKKKVDPSYVLDVNLATAPCRDLESMMRQELRNENVFVKRLMEEKFRMEFERQRFAENYNFANIPPLLMRGPPQVLFPPQMTPPSSLMMRHPPDSYNDQHVDAKHTNVYPTENELESIQSIVSTCEKCLKLISDIIPISDGSSEKPTIGDGKVMSEQQRSIRGVMRVGSVAKGLLLRGDRCVELVALCAKAPTKDLLSSVIEEFPKQLETFTSDKFDIESCEDRACFIVKQATTDKLEVSCTITLTSPVLREPVVGAGTDVTKQSSSEPEGILDRDSCLAALAELRRAKWFQARANGLPSCVIILRVLRDLCQRMEKWKCLSHWSLELLVEKCLSSEGGIGHTPGTALRRIFECVAAGVLLPGASGLVDPCEKDQMDASSYLTGQQREDVTAAAQEWLRLIAFRKIYTVLGIDELPQWKTITRPKRSLPPSDNNGHQEKARKVETSPA